jgi:catechol 2,3-dioxygenase-like lactoylglutathione lyase family enzyme
MKIKQIDITMHVPSLEKTQEWYKRILGWESGCDLHNEKGECIFGDVYYSREPLLGFNLLKTDGTIKPSGFHPLIKVDDLESLLLDLKEKNVAIIQDLRIQHWGKNIRIKDVNGFELEFWAELEQK